MKRIASFAGCLGWLPLLLLVLSCSSISVHREFDSATDFSRYHTFAWQVGAKFPPGSLLGPGSDLDLQFKHAIEAQLAAAGLRPSKDGKPDLYVTYYAFGSDKLELTGVEYKLAPGVSWIGDPATHTEHSYAEGTLEVDLVEAASDHVVWHGTATDGAQTLGGLRNRIDDAARKLFRGYPPRHR